MRTALIILAILTTLNGYAQQDINEIFVNLKQGAILVRLQTKQKTITALKQKNPDLARKIEAAQQKRNNEIIAAFDTCFNYCPTYFFYDYNSTKIKNKTFQGTLLDKNMAIIDSIPTLLNNYLIAAFAQTGGDTMQMEATVKTYDKDGNIISEQEDNYSGHTGYKIDALVLLSPNLKLLQDPHPHYVRQNVIVRQRAPHEMIYLLEQKIIKAEPEHQRLYLIAQEKRLKQQSTETLDSIVSNMKNSLSIGFMGAAQTSTLSISYEHFINKQASVNLSIPTYFTYNGKEIGFSLSYRNYQKESMNSPFVGLFLNYSSLERIMIEKTTGNNTQETKLKHNVLCVGVNAGRKWIADNGLTFTLRGGVGYPMKTTSSWSIKPDKEQYQEWYEDFYKNLSYFDLEISIGYSF